MYGAGTLARTPLNCPHCGLIHETTCQRIKAIEYDVDGNPKRVEFFTPGELAPRSILELNDQAVRK